MSNSKYKFNTEQSTVKELYGTPSFQSSKLFLKYRCSESNAAWRKKKKRIFKLRYDILWSIQKEKYIFTYQERNPKFFWYLILYALVLLLASIYWKSDCFKSYAIFTKILDESYRTSLFRTRTRFQSYNCVPSWMKEL